LCLSAGLGQAVQAVFSRFFLLIFKCVLKGYLNSAFADQRKELRLTPFYFLKIFILPESFSFRHKKMHPLFGCILKI